jgi:hypothetical protein
VQRERKEWYKKWWGILFIMCFFYVFIPYYIWKKTNWKKNTKIITTSIFVLLMIIFMIGGANKEKEDIAKYNTAVEKIKENKIDEAKKILTELQTTESNELLKELKFLDDEVMVYSTLTDLTDDEFKSLKNGTLNKEILKNKDVNKLLINKVRTTKDIDNVRKEALASLEKGRKKAKLEKLFSSWDGSNVALTKSIKESMNDPGSYKHNETRYKEIDDNTLFIITSFRGKNAFGGVVLNSCSAKQDIETELITEMNCE